MKIVTWNVNGIRAREANVLAWLEAEQPDYLLLQEIKCEEASFPVSFAKAGWHAAISGHKGFNGVEVLAKSPLKVTQHSLPEFKEEVPKARYIEVDTGEFLIGNLYLPNGNSGGDAGYANKIDFMKALLVHAEKLLRDERPFLLAGDFNVCPEPVDCAKGALSEGDALIRPETIENYWPLIWAGLTDGLRAVHPHGAMYTFWDYQGGAFDRNRGVRIDHVLLSPALTERLVDVKVDRTERNRANPSDHAPVVAQIR